MSAGVVILSVAAVLAAILIVLLGAAAANAATNRSKLERDVPGPPLVDEDKAQLYARHLSRMVQVPTVAGTDDTARAGFAALRNVTEDCYPLITEKLARTLLGDAQLYRWQGADSTLPAVLLMSHSDVVPAGGKWTYPPFAGDIAEDCVWGRGTVDTKGSLCAIYEAVEGLLAEGFVPPCDVYIASSCNEEVMGDGAPDIRDYLAKQGVALRIVSDEGGAVVEGPLPGLDGFYAMMGVCEKGYSNVRFTATSEGGHASTPPKNTPLAQLAAFVQDVEKHSPFEKKIDGPVRQMFETLVPHMSFGYRMLLGNLWLFGPLLKVILPKVSGEAAAMLSTTCAFTMAEGSPAANVLPATASVTANLRFAPHQPKDASLAAIRAVAERHGLAMDVEYACDVSPVSPVDSAEYKYMVNCAEAVFPEAVATPYLMLGGTDSRHFAPQCPCTVRFAPTAITAQQRRSVHGVDENLGVGALYRAVEFYTSLVRGLPGLYGA